MNKKSMILATLLNNSEISASVEGYFPIKLIVVAIPSTIITSEIS